MGSPRDPGSSRWCQMHPRQESYAVLDHRAARPTLNCHLLHQTPSQTSLLRKLNIGHHGRGGSHSDSPEPHGHPRDLPARSPLSARAPLGDLAVRTAIQDTIKTSRWLLTLVAFSSHGGSALTLVTRAEAWLDEAHPGYTATNTEKPATFHLTNHSAHHSIRLPSDLVESDEELAPRS